MHSIQSTLKLKEAIRELQRKQVVQGELLKEQFAITVEGIRPAFLLKSIGSNIFSAGVAGKIVNAAVGLTVGYVTKRMLIGSSVNRLKGFLGNAMQVGVLGLIAKKPDLVKSLISSLLKIFTKKKVIS